MQTREPFNDCGGKMIKPATLNRSCGQRTPAPSLGQTKGTAGFITTIATSLVAFVTQWESGIVVAGDGMTRKAENIGCPAFY